MMEAPKLFHSADTECDPFNYIYLCFFSISPKSSNKKLLYLYSLYGLSRKKWIRITELDKTDLIVFGLHYYYAERKH